MKTIGIRELREKASEVLRRVREKGDVYEVTYRGRVVARLVPASQPGSGVALPEIWAEWDKLAREVSARWPKGVSAVEAVREQRREL